MCRRGWDGMVSWRARGENIGTMEGVLGACRNLAWGRTSLGTKIYEEQNYQRERNPCKVIVISFYGIAII